MVVKILVVEDKEHHQNDAKKILAERIKGIDFSFASTYTEAMNKLRGGGYSGVLSDLFLPTESGDEAGIVQSLLECYYDWLYKEEMPYGVLLAKHAMEKGMPVVLITDTYHHGKKTEPVYRWAKKTRVPLIDRNIIDDEGVLEEEGINPSHLEDKIKRDMVKQHVSKRKEWLKGFLSLLWMIGRKKGGVTKISAEKIIGAPACHWVLILLKALLTGDDTETRCLQLNAKEGFNEMVDAYYIK